MQPNVLLLFGLHILVWATFGMTRMMMRGSDSLPWVGGYHPPPSEVRG
jgi:hypothetical protein